MLLSRIKGRIALRRASSKDVVGRKQKIIKKILKLTPILRIVFFVVGVAWILLLPSKEFNKRTYISENALLPGQVNVYFGYNDIQTADRYRYILKDIQDKDNEQRADYIRTEFRRMGFVSALQHFDANGQQGVNAFAIYRAPRSDGKEALILSAPWISRTGEYNTNGIAVLLALAKLFKRNVYWSKDIILLVTDRGMTGTQAWLDSYHWTDQEGQASFSSLVMPRSGAIQGVVNLDFPGTQDYQSLGLYFEGVNGQLPNLDLINTIGVIASRTARVPITLHDEPWHPYQRSPRESYVESLKNMLRTMQYQALGHPSSESGLYLRYKVDAVTIHGVRGTRDLNALFGFHRIGMLVESTFRSLNNLLEHFHQSFFFYLLPQYDRYVSIGDYMPPVILLACSLIFQSLVLYYIHPEAETDTSTEKDSAVPPAYQTRPRHLTFAYGVLTLTHLVGFAIFYIMQAPVTPEDAYEQNEFRFAMVSLLATVVVLGVGFYVHQSASPKNDARILKSFCLALSGLVISTVSLLNYSLAVFTAVAIVLPYSFVAPNKSWPVRVLQLCLLTALSPPGLVSIFTSLTGTPLGEVLHLILEDYHIVHSWLLFYICIAYWPTNMAMQILVFSK